MIGFLHVVCSLCFLTEIILLTVFSVTRHTTLGVNLNINMDEELLKRMHDYYVDKNKGGEL